MTDKCQPCAVDVADRLQLLRAVIEKISMNVLSVFELLLSVSPSGVLYNQFLSQADFEVLRDRAQVGLCFLIDTINTY